MLKIEVNRNFFTTFQAEGTAITMMAEMTLCMHKLIREIGMNAAKAGADARKIMDDLYKAAGLALLEHISTKEGGGENDSSQLLS